MTDCSQDAYETAYWRKRFAYRVATFLAMGSAMVIVGAAEFVGLWTVALTIPVMVAVTLYPVREILKGRLGA